MTKMRPSFEFYGKDKYCNECGASMKAFWQRITPGQVKALIQMSQKVRESGQNRVSKHDLELSHGGYANLPKLRYHGLIDKVKNEDGKIIKGEWVITARGVQFLRGDISIPKEVLTFRNKVIEVSDDTTWIKEVMKKDEWFQSEYQRVIMRTK